MLDLSLRLLGKDRVPHEVLGKTYNQVSKQPNKIIVWGTFDHSKFDVDDNVTFSMTFPNRASMQFECSGSANIKEDKVLVSLS
ncbi:dehydrogenase, partial [Staphylococcus aureus]